MNEEEIRNGIKSLINKYNKLKKEKELKEISESNIRADFIDELFSCLGWDVKNLEEYDRERYVRKTGFVDICLKLDNKPIIFIEAKRFGGIPSVAERGDKDWTLEERQVILYCNSKEKIKWAILTNFEKFRVFNALTGLTVLNFEEPYEYLNRFNELILLSKENVLNKKIEKLALREEREDIDKEFLNLLNSWRLKLANDIYKNNQENEFLKTNGKIDMEKLKDAVQRILDRLIIFRFAEDTLILENPSMLEMKYNEWKLSPTYISIVDSLFADRQLFDRFNTIHDGKIFERGHLCEKVKISDESFGEIINDMIQRSFRKFNFDVLGNTYETYLGNTLYLKNGEIGLKPSMEERKEEGIYYTPSYVVDYIVKNTLGIKLEEIKKDCFKLIEKGDFENLKEKVNEVKKIRVLDPACGSGSFLIKTYDYFKKFYENVNEKIREKREKALKEFAKKGNQLKLSFEVEEFTNYEKEILKNNIFGVDLDRQACEVASVNLMLKTLKAREKLPLILEENIKCGNSLISGSKEELRKYFEEDLSKEEIREYFGKNNLDELNNIDFNEACKIKERKFNKKLKEEIKPFNWENEFGKDFDVVVGNPPYVNIEKISEEDYKFFTDKFKTAFRRFDLYILFMESSFNKFLKKDGMFGFIIPDKVLTQSYSKKLRRLMLSNCTVEKIIDLTKWKIFQDATNKVVIVIIKNSPCDSNHEIEIINQIEDPNKIDKIDGEIHKVKQIKFKDMPNYMFRIYWNNKKENIVQKIQSKSFPLEFFCYVSWGAQPGIYDRVIFYGNEGHCKNKKDILCSYPKSECPSKHGMCKKLIKGENIERYSILLSNSHLVYDITKLNRPAFPELFETLKIVISEVSGTKGIIATLDNEKYYTDHSLANCILKKDLVNVDEKILKKRGIHKKLNENRIIDNPFKIEFLDDDSEELAYTRGTDIYKEDLQSQYDLKYILGIINSELIGFYFKEYLSGELNVFPELIRNLPIRIINFSNPSEKSIHDKIISFVDKMLSLKSQRNAINTNFEQHINQKPRIKDKEFSQELKKLKIEDKIILKRDGKSASQIIGEKIYLIVEEENAFLNLKIKYNEKTKKGEEITIEFNAFKFRFEDIFIRKFLYYCLNSLRNKSLGKGNLLEKIHKIKIPCFSEDEEKNKNAIYEVMKPFLKNVEERQKLEKEINEIDREIDKLVYALYGLSEEEIKIVEGGN